MIAPVHNLSKKEIIWLANHRCQHRHTFFNHYNCYLSENPEKERIGFLDIETTNFEANNGVILSYSIKVHGQNKFFEGVVNKKEITTHLDKKIVGNLINDMAKFDRLITYYGSRFDIPFIRTRAVAHGIDMTGYGTMYHNDLYFLIRNKFKLSRNSLEVACRTLLGATNKTHFDGIQWMKAIQGNPKSLAFIMDHNHKDVIDLEKLYDKVVGFGKVNDTSW